MPLICDLPRIKAALKTIDPIQAIEAGFIAYSKGDVVVPPVGELSFEEPPGDVHIKYGYISNDEYYVIKIASGFYRNLELGLPTSNGLMLVFDQKTGALLALLHDEGYLTDVRTAAAGAVAARYLAPKSVSAIGIVGTGVQARLQLQYLKTITLCRQVMVWGRSAEKMDKYQQDMAALDFQVQATQDIAELAAGCNLIVTTTAAKSPLLQADDIKPGTHITAMGSDTIDKIELEPEILGRADRVVADSISQCLERGEISQALRKQKIRQDSILELGEVITNTDLQRTADTEITVADLTGVAVQDIQISKAVLAVLDTG